MTSPSDGAPGAPASVLPKVAARYAEFLPAAVEIAARPTPKAVVGLIAIIVAATAAAIAWSAIARLDEFTNAVGRVRTSAPAALLQPMEAGSVTDITVDNGQKVKAGQTLIVLDDKAVRTEHEATVMALTAWQAERVRRKAAIEAAISGQRPVDAVFDPSVPPDVAERERASLRASLSALDAAVAAKTAEAQEASARRVRAEGVKAVREKLMSVLTERQGMQEKLLDSAAGSRAAVLGINDQLFRVEADLVDTATQLAEIDAAVERIMREKRQLVEQFLDEETRGIQAAERQIEQLAKQAEGLADRLSHFVIKAPIDGVVQQLAVTSPGQVVATGQSIAVVVPEGGPLLVEALLPSADVGFVALGDEAVIKADAFPFTRYGTFSGRIAAISDEAVAAAKVLAMQDPSEAGRGEGIGQPTGIPDVAGLHYILKIAPDDPRHTSTGRPLSLQSGMTVRVEIKTESRSVLSFLMSPLAETLANSGHER